MAQRKSSSRKKNEKRRGVLSVRIGIASKPLQKKSSNNSASDTGHCPACQEKIGKVMDEFKAGTLSSGSKKGPKVRKRSQAIAIALSESRRAKKKKK